MTYSAVLIIAAAMKPNADAIGAALDWGPESYTIPLGDGETITHYAARVDVGIQFVRWLRGLDPLPDPAFQPVITALQADFSPDPHPDDATHPEPALWGQAHLARVVAEMGLVQMASRIR